MKSFIEVFVKALVRGVLYSIGFGVVGGLAGLLLGKGFIVGSYMAILGGACVAMLVAAWNLIGSPKKRFEFFTHRKDKEKTDSSEKVEMGTGGMYPTIIAVEMLLIGFVIEALLH